MKISFIDEIINEIGSSEEASIPLLQAIQKQFGYIPLESLNELAEKTELHLNRLYGVVTFYSQFKLIPQGKYVIKICKGTACHVKGADRLIVTLEEELGVKLGENTSDGLFSIEEVACLGCCSLAPAMMIGDKVYGNLTLQKVKKIIKGIRDMR